eukprot:12407635-Karenia_brevis.AAC.1
MDGGMDGGMDTSEGLRPHQPLHRAQGWMDGWSMMRMMMTMTMMMMMMMSSPANITSAAAVDQESVDTPMDNT